MKPAAEPLDRRAMPKILVKALLLVLAFALIATVSARAQIWVPAQPQPQLQQPQPQAPARRPTQPYVRHHRRERREAEPATVPVLVPDSRDHIVAAAGSFNGRPYWLALAKCGGIYFKLNLLYTTAAVRARVVKPDPRANARFTKELNEAIRVATTYFDGAERFLMNDRGVERDAAVLTYDAWSREAGERLTTIESALAAAKTCPALYQACLAAFPKTCSEPLPPIR